MKNFDFQKIWSRKWKDNLKTEENIVNHIYIVKELYSEYVKSSYNNKIKQNLTEN